MGASEHAVEISSRSDAGNDGGPSTSQPGLSFEWRALLAVALAVLVYLIIQKLYTRRYATKYGPSILLMGPSGAGKTALYHQVEGTDVSMQHNKGTFRSIKEAAISSVHFVDLPGQPHQKHQIEAHIRAVAGVVFVLDATDFMPQIKVIAAQLYDLLSHPVFCNNHLPLLLACNKADLGAKAHTESFIVKLLEKELETHRETHYDFAHSGELVVGRPGEVFAFEHVMSKIAVAKVSAITGDIEPIFQFIRECVKY